jgi:hypothetical protein
MNDEELDELQDQLIKEAEEEELPEMRVDGRSVYTLRDTIEKKAKPDDDRES